MVEATNLYQTRFLNLSAADWINLAISLVLVFLMMALISRLIFMVLMKIAKRSATPYDVIYLKAIQPILHWLFNILILYIATARLQFLSPVFQAMAGANLYRRYHCPGSHLPVETGRYHPAVVQGENRAPGRETPQ